MQRFTEPGCIRHHPNVVGTTSENSHAIGTRIIDRRVKRPGASEPGALWNQVCPYRGAS